MFSQNNRNTKTAKIASIIGVALLTTGANGALAREAPFTFARAEFMRSDRGMIAAQNFIASQLPSGIPMQEARKRLSKADMGCGHQGEPGEQVSCQFYELAGRDGGTLGEDRWTVLLTADGANNLQTATLDRTHSGFEG